MFGIVTWFCLCFCLVTQSGVESIFEQAIIQHYHMDVPVEITSIDTCDIERDRVVIVQHVLHFFRV